jgi:TonB family protein
MNTLLSTPALSWFLSYLFNALWQIPLLFVAAWIAARMLHRTDPRVEHRIWVGALLLQVMLPACDFHVTSLWHALLNLLSSTGTVSSGGVHIFLGSAATGGGGTLRLPFALEAGLVLAWMCCIVYFAARLAWGLWQTRTLARSATRLTLTGDAALSWTGHCHRMGITAPTPAIAVSPQEVGPVTIGLWHGLVLVPSTFLENISAGDLDAVLAHELAHIQRRDFAKNVLYGIAALPIAWHPVACRTRMRVAESRELVCDAMAADAITAAAVAGRRQYAQSLLRLASILSAGPRVATLHALGILSLNTDARIFERRIMSLTRKHTPISATRRILVAASCCVIALATCASALALRTDVAALPSAAESKTPKKISVSSAVMTGLKISGDNPTYPKEARAKKIQGAVVLEATVSKDGAIENLHVVKTPDPSLAESALKAVRTWRYRPYLLNGERVAVQTTINVVYNLGG